MSNHPDGSHSTVSKPVGKLRQRHDQLAWFFRKVSDLRHRPITSDRDRLRATGTDDASAEAPKAPTTWGAKPCKALRAVATTSLRQPKVTLGENPLTQRGIARKSEVLRLLARLRRAGFEPATFGSVDRLPKP